MRSWRLPKNMKYVWSDMLRMQLAIEHVLSSGQYSIEHLWGYSFFLQSNKSPYRDNHNMKDWTDWFKTWKYIDESKVPGILLSIVMFIKAKKNQANFFLSMLTLSFSLYPLQNRMKWNRRKATNLERINKS